MIQLHVMAISNKLMLSIHGYISLECKIQLPKHTWGLADDIAHHFI